MIHVITGLSASLLKKPSSRYINETMFITYVNAPNLFMLTAKQCLNLQGMTIFNSLSLNQ